MTVGTIHPNLYRDHVHILDAAERVFVRKTYRHAAVEEIAREAGISVGSIYNVFSDKHALYTQVVVRVGEALVARIEYGLRGERDPKRALRQLILLRLYNYSRDRLLLDTFFHPHEIGAEPDPASLGPRVASLYRDYLSLVEARILAVTQTPPVEGAHDYRAALSLEGLITAFMGYWASPRHANSLANVAADIMRILLRGVAADNTLVSPPPAHHETPSRDIYITTFDLERLREVLAVAQSFGTDDSKQYLDILDAELADARIVHSRDVPPDLITMNSRLRLRNAATGEEIVRSLVFPKDALDLDDCIPILSPLGTALLGFRLGDTVAVPGAPDGVRYVVEEILYQPEAAGDFHL